jgi:hypothetical protein
MLRKKINLEIIQEEANRVKESSARDRKDNQEY